MVVPGQPRLDNATISSKSRGSRVGGRALARGTEQITLVDRGTTRMTDVISMLCTVTGELDYTEQKYMHATFQK
jgi:hypothetical protein